MEKMDWDKVPKDVKKIVLRVALLMSNDYEKRIMKPTPDHLEASEDALARLRHSWEIGDAYVLALPEQVDRCHSEALSKAKPIPVDMATRRAR